MKKIFGLLMVVGILAAASGVGWGDVPHYINFQGKITPVPQSISQILFNIGGKSYNAGPIAYNNQTGVFNTTIGSSSQPLDPNDFDGTLTAIGFSVMGVSADGSQLQAKFNQDLQSVPYAFRAAVADKIGPLKSLELYDGTNPFLRLTSAGAAWDVQTVANRFDVRNGSVLGLSIDNVSGNVGIGTTTPLSKLQVEDKSNKPALSILNLAGAAQGISVTAIGSSGDKYGASIMTAGSGGANNALYASASGASNQNIAGHFSATGSPKNYAIYAEAETNYFSGQVGIGTINPQAKLDIGGTPGVDGIRFPDGTVQTSAAASTAWATDGTSKTNTNLHVGIGTTTPTAKLVVVQPQIIGGSTGDLLKLSTSLRVGLSTTYSDKFIVKGDGNVGIGTATPANKLSVSGNADFTGLVGIGTTNPSATLDVSGNIRSGYVITSSYGIQSKGNSAGGLFETSSGIGMYSRSTSDGGIGAYAESVVSGTTKAIGYIAKKDSANKYWGVRAEGEGGGVFGNSPSGIGVSGNGGVGINGVGTLAGGSFESSNGYGVYGKYSGTASRSFGYIGSSANGIYGKYVQSDGAERSYGFLGSAAYGVYGRHIKVGGYLGPYGYLGDSGVGVYGRYVDTSDSAYQRSFGYLGAKDIGAYGGYIASGGEQGPYGMLGTQLNGVYGNVGMYSGFTGVYAGYFDGPVHIAGKLTKSSGAFLIDHPLDPKNKILRHSFVESPDMKNIYDGIVLLNDQGEGVISLPLYFEALNKDFRYQLTPLGDYAPLFIKKKVKNNSFTIAGGKPGMEVSWQITGVRKDAYALKNPIIVEEEKGSGNSFPKGKYLNPKAFEGAE